MRNKNVDSKVKFKVGHIIGLCVAALFVAVIIAGDAVCGVYSSSITMQLCGTGVSFDGENVDKVLALGDEVCQDLVSDGITLLENNGTLPLKNLKKVNLFGWSSTDNGFMLSGVGSAAATINAEKKVTLRQAFADDGIEINQDLYDAYVDFSGSRRDKQSIDDVNCITMIEPNREFYITSVGGGKSLLQGAKDFSDTAIITITRYGGELMEQPLFQNKYRYDADYDRTALMLSTEEQAMLEMCCENFENVIVLLNLCNAMQLDFLKTIDGIDAALFVGTPGQSGTRSIVKAITGEINPSGKMSDITPYDHRSDPTWVNKRKSAGNQITYAEDIYFGYRWYETAAVEGYFDEVDNEFGKGYDGVVQYPFGFGRSYTTFDWQVGEVSFELSGYIDDKNTSFEIEVIVTNTGDVAGKDVVQVYYTAPYYDGGIEKAHVNLVAFEKTELLDPNQSQTLKITFDLYDMASYDCYDRNGNGNRGWELDPGEYSIMVMRDSHTLADCDNAELKFKIRDLGEDGILRGLTYKQDPVTKARVRNRFTGETAYGGYAIDGTTDGSKVTYLSRSDFEATFPTVISPDHKGSALAAAAEYIYSGYEGMGRPTQSSSGSAGELLITTTESGGAPSKSQLETSEGIVYNEDLIKRLGADYNHADWEKLLDQLTEDDVRNIVAFGGFGIKPITSIGKNHLFEVDGPSGFHSGIMELNTSQNKWTGYPGEFLIGCTWNKFLMFEYGRAIGAEGVETGVAAIYAPGVNLHRTPYNGRYHEYYSEDPVLSGYLATEFIYGAKTNGVTCYIKHFIVSEMGINPRGTYVWLTEQSLRELYFKPFEIAVKKGGANAVMSAFNRLGATWAGANKALLTDVLRKEWGFKGVVLTDFVRSPDSYMNCTQGIRAGNDVWLNGADTTDLDLKANDAMYCARLAAKNSLFAYTNTVYTQLTYDGLPDRFSTEVGIRSTEKVFAWWIPVLAVVNVLIFAASVLTIVFMLNGAGVWKTKKQRAAIVTASVSTSASVSAGEGEQTVQEHTDIIAEKEPTTEVVEEQTPEPVKEESGEAIQEQTSPEQSQEAPKQPTTKKNTPKRTSTATATKKKPSQSATVKQTLDKQAKEISELKKQISELVSIIKDNDKK